MSSFGILTQSVRRSLIVLCLTAASVVCATAPAGAAGALTAIPTSAQLGAPITFLVSVQPKGPAGVPTPLRLDFGDGTGVSFVATPTSFVHVYQRAGQYTALLTDANTGRNLGTAVVTIVQPTFRPGRAPIGRIYTTTLTIPSVLAGGETAIVVRYSIGDASYAGGGTPILAYVELRTAKGTLIRRSDPFEIIPGASAGMQSAVIPYSVPVDAGGSYALRVVLRAAGGGSIAASDSMPLLVAAGPDPKPELHTEFRASGALEVGPNAASGTTFNPGTVVALQWPTHQLSLSGLYDPVSHRPDPLFTLESRAPGTVQSPSAPATPDPNATPDANATPGASATAVPSAAPAPVGSFKDTLGRSATALPALMGEGTTLRGLDATRSVGPWVLHGGYGYAQLATPGLPAERAGIIDVGRTLGAGNVRAALYQREDDIPLGYILTPNVPGPLRALVAELDAKQPVVRRNVTFTASAANSNAQSLVQPLNVNDAAARRGARVRLGHDERAARIPQRRRRLRDGRRARRDERSRRLGVEPRLRAEPEGDADARCRERADALRRVAPDECDGDVRHGPDRQDARDDRAAPRRASVVRRAHHGRPGQRRVRDRVLGWSAQPQRLARRAERRGDARQRRGDANGDGAVHPAEQRAYARRRLQRYGRHRSVRERASRRKPDVRFPRRRQARRRRFAARVRAAVRAHQHDGELTRRGNGGPGALRDRLLPRHQAPRRRRARRGAPSQRPRDDAAGRKVRAAATPRPHAMT